MTGNHCYAVLVENLDVFDGECLKLGISKVLGLGLVVFGSIVKLPQLMKLFNAKSGAGLSVSGYILETISYIITVAYNYRLRFPFSTYGETVFMVIQNIFILHLIFHYARKDVYGIGVVGGALAVAYVLFDSNLISYNTLKVLQGLTIPLSLTSKLPQIYSNYRNSSTGQLSAFTVFNYLAGTLARVFTTVTEVNDPVILWGFIASATLNAVIAGQMMYYWDSTKSRPKPKPLKAPTTPRTSTRQKTPRTPKTPSTVPTTPEKPTTPDTPKTPSRKGRGKKKT